MSSGIRFGIVVCPEIRVASLAFTGDVHYQYCVVYVMVCGVRGGSYIMCTVVAGSRIAMVLVLVWAMCTMLPMLNAGRAGAG